MHIYNVCSKADKKFSYHKDIVHCGWCWL